MLTGAITVQPTHTAVHEATKLIPASQLVSYMHAYNIMCHSPILPYWLFYSRDDIFMNFTKKVAFGENIIMNSCASVALLHLKQSAS